ncbi:hypothetical protein [Sphingomonas sp. TREG-RG-20F-R18-01]|uniref:hypothetical protein n=1 Tax=Sphingomonas sp. TREG-RG-20F-R18-01 TaxID=2914982 RepID=UPI001F5A0111|nr:hypothetical protein [Sphingomonas sp. TREG-RG-20F-R18-01]
MDGIADQMIAALTGHELNTTQSIIATYMPNNTAMAARAVAIFSARSADAKDRRKPAALLPTKVRSF